MGGFDDGEVLEETMMEGFDGEVSEDGNDDFISDDDGDIELGIEDSGSEDHGRSEDSFD
jgi:hypothetical protein